jgi:Ca2+-binding RTX toxin-like protein
VIVVGQSWGRTASTVNPFQIAAVLYRANGTLDSSFHGNGKLLIHYRPGANDNGAAVIRQSDGKFLISGSSWFSTADPPVEAAIRLTPDGKLDPTFADHGTLLLTTSSPFSSGATDLIAQPDGRSLLAAGFNGTASVWRLLDDAAPAPSAAISGDALIITGSASPDLIRVVRSGNTVQLTGFPVSFPTTAFSRIAITGLGGNDRIDASNIDLPLTIDGGDGNDFILGGAGAETLTGGAGDDTLFGGKGNDLIHGGDGNDYLSAGPGSNTLFGDAGNDQIFALNTTLDRIDGGAGFDREKGDASDLLTSIEGLLA